MVDTKAYINSNTRLLKYSCESSESKHNRSSGKAVTTKNCDISFSRKDLMRTSPVNKGTNKELSRSPNAPSIQVRKTSTSPPQVFRCFVPLANKKHPAKPTPKISEKKPKKSSKIEISLANYIDREFRFLQNHKIDRLRESTYSRPRVNSRLFSKSESLVNNPRQQTTDSMKLRDQSDPKKSRMTSPRRISQLIMQEKRPSASPGSQDPEQSKTYSLTDQHQSPFQGKFDMKEQPTTKRKIHQPVPKLVLTPTKQAKLFSRSDGFLSQSTQRARAQDKSLSKNPPRTLFGNQRTQITK